MSELTLHTVHTADVGASTLAVARALLDDAFDGEFSDADWDHTLGGMHALLWRDRLLIGHGSVVQRRLLNGGRALRTGYVEGVGVHAEHRRQGHAGTIMKALERVVHDAYDLGALSASATAADFYAARGWRRWHGPTSVLSPSGIQRTADDDDGVHVLDPLRALVPDGPLVCDWRDGDVW